MGTLDQLAEKKQADAAALYSEPSQLLDLWGHFKNLANASYMLEKDWLTVSE